MNKKIYEDIPLGSMFFFCLWAQRVQKAKVGMLMYGQSVTCRGCGLYK